MPKNEDVEKEEIRAKLEAILADDDIHYVAILAAPDVENLIVGAKNLIGDMKGERHDQ